MALIVETPKPALIEDRDVILKVTGSTVCGSDLHLLHGELNRPFPVGLDLTREFQVPLSKCRKAISWAMNFVAKSNRWALG